MITSAYALIVIALITIYFGDPIRSSEIPATTDDDPIAVLAIGQSNMVGRYGPAETVMANSVKVWTGSEWVAAVLGQPPFMRDRVTNGVANNLSFVFAEQLAEASQCEVRLVLLASDGKRIEYFLPNFILERNDWENHQESTRFGGSLAEEIFGTNGTAATALDDINISHFDVVLVHQGEANFAPQAEYPWVYENKVIALLEEMVRRDIVSNSTQFLFGHINPDYYFSREHRIALESLEYENLSVIEWAGIEDVGSVDGNGDPHATGRGLQALGERYYETFQRHSSPSCAQE